jgi:putative membrane protein
MNAKTIVKMTALAGLAMLLETGLRAQTPSEPTTPTPQRGQLSESDYRFVIHAARGGMEEINLGQIAKEKSQNQAVRDFAERMITDHGKANDQLKQLATQKGATLPPTLSRTGRTRVDELQGLTGTEFDKAYAKGAVKDHKEDVKEFEKASKDLKDPDLRAWAQQTLPTLQEHQQMAESLETSVKAEGK